MVFFGTVKILTLIWSHGLILPNIDIDYKDFTAVTHLALCFVL